MKNVFVHIEKVAQLQADVLWGQTYSFAEYPTLGLRLNCFVFLFVEAVARTTRESRRAVGLSQVVVVWMALVQDRLHHSSVFQRLIK